MPCSHGRANSNFEKFLERGSCPEPKRYRDLRANKLFSKISKRYLEHKASMSFSKVLCSFTPSKERQDSPAFLRNSEPRCIIFTIVTLEFDSWKLVAPCPLVVQSSDLKNYLDSEARVKGGGLESPSSLLTVIIQVDLPTEQKTNSSECSGSSKSCNSSGDDVLSQFRNRNKQTKSSKNFSTSPPRSIISNNFSPSDCDGSSLASSDALVNSIPKVDRSVKRVSRKKRKKKGKQHKKNMSKKVSNVLKTQCEESIYDTSILGTAISTDTATTSELNSDNNLSEDRTSCTFPLPDIEIEQVETQIKNNEVMNCSATQLVCRSYKNEINQPTPLSESFGGEEISCNQLDMSGGSDHLAIKSTSTQSPEIILSEENMINAHPINGIHCDFSHNISFDNCNTPAVVSCIDERKTDISENCSNDGGTWSSIKDGEEGLHSPKSGIILNNDYSFPSSNESSCDVERATCTTSYRSNHTWPKDITDTDYNTERAECSSQVSSSDEFQPVINRKKRARLNKKASQNFCGIHRFGKEITHGRTRKDNDCSLWQSVQRNVTEEYICEPNRVNLVSRCAETSCKGSERKEKGDTSVELNENGVGNPCAYTYAEAAIETPQTDMIRTCSFDCCDSNKILPRGIVGRYNVPEKLKRKQNPGYKQGNYNPINMSHTYNTNIDRPSKDCVQQKVFGILPQLSLQQYTSIGIKSYCSDLRNTVVIPPVNVDFCQPEHYKTQNSVEEDTSSEGTNSIACNTSSNVAENPVSPSARTSNPLHHIHIKDQCDSSENLHEDSCLEDSEHHKYLKPESENSCSDNSKLENVYVDKKDFVAVDIVRTGSLTDVVNEPVLGILNQEEVELRSSIDKSLQMNTGVPYLIPCFEDTVCPSSVENVRVIAHPHVAVEYGGMFAAPNRCLAVSNRCLTYETNDRCFASFESDLDKIVQTVDDSYRLQTASEGVRLMTGYPVAEFEKFIVSASPVLDRISCRTCSPDQLISDSFCGHPIPNIPLGRLWQWYEKPGSYGMEVKAKGYNGFRTSHDGGSEFHAYFVPYLSAIQLFGRSRSAVYANNPYPSEEVIEDCESDEFCYQSVRNTRLDDGELLFEYFESDQPQKRRPLFEKIKELIRRNTSSDSKLYGDPLTLECLNLHDLHPSSWYSVAWYPIYRIPDGNLRATFLTYHSLGCFVSSRSKRPGAVAQIVSPVVGLQNYNAKDVDIVQEQESQETQTVTDKSDMPPPTPTGLGPLGSGRKTSKGECWFQPRGLKSKLWQREAAIPSDPWEILEERLKTLEQTAYVMATTSVRKGNLRSVNKQPDYEFFISRRL